VSAWQVIHERNRLRVLVVAGREDLDEASLTMRLLQALGTQGAILPEIWIERVAAIPRSVAGKAPLIIESKAD
jgi:hypothetical protein